VRGLAKKPTNRLIIIPSSTLVVLIVAVSGFFKQIKRRHNLGNYKALERGKFGTVLKIIKYKIPPQSNNSDYE